MKSELNVKYSEMTAQQAWTHAHHTSAYCIGTASATNEPHFKMLPIPQTIAQYEAGLMQATLNRQFTLVCMKLPCHVVSL